MAPTTLRQGIDAAVKALANGADHAIVALPKTTPDPDPYTRAQELIGGATPTQGEALVFTLHLQGHDPGRSAAWQVAAHLSRGQIRAILAR